MPSCSTAPSKVHPAARAAAPDEQDIEYTVLDYLSDGQPAKSATLRHATGATAELLTNMLRKKWLLRETEAAPRDARRLVRYAVLVADARPPKLNDNQLAILAELAGAGGSLPVPVLRRLGLPATTLQTLVKRGLVTIEERPAAFHLSAAATTGSARAQPRPASRAGAYRGHARSARASALACCTA